MAVPTKYRGIFPAFYACYDEEGRISRDRIATLAEYYHSIGIPGLYLSGSSGECVLHTADERKMVVEAAMEAVGGKMTMIAHIAAPSTQTSIELARHAEKLGVDAISMVPGFYYSLNDAVVQKYWMDVLDATDRVPLVIYNIPGTTNGFNLSSPLFERMMATGRVLGIKNSSDSVLDILRFRMAGGEDAVIFNGPDEQYLAGRMMGASGGIGGTYGYMPKLFLRLEELIQGNLYESAKKLQSEITDLINCTLGAASLYAAAKGVLKADGIDIGSVRAPFLPLRDEDEELVCSLHRRINETLIRYEIN